MDIYEICDLQGAAEDAIRALQAIKDALDAAIKEHEDRRGNPAQPKETNR